MIGSLKSNEEDGGGGCLFGVSYYVCSEEGESDSVCDDEWERPMSLATFIKVGPGRTCRNP